MRPDPDYSLSGQHLFNSIPIGGMKKTSLIFHTFVLIHHLFTMYHMQKLSTSYTQLPYGRARDLLSVGSRFFTTWNMTVQTFYFFLAFVLDLCKFCNQSSMNRIQANLTRFNGYVYNVIMFPATLLVGMGFWALFSIKREWVLPQSLEDISPVWLNHAVHTTIIPVLLGELLVYVGDMPRPKFKTAIIALNFYFALYNFQYLYTYYQLGFWLYGIYYEINWSQRLALTIINFLILAAFLKVGYWIQNYKRYTVK